MLGGGCKGIWKPSTLSPPNVLPSCPQSHANISLSERRFRSLHVPAASRPRLRPNTSSRGSGEIVGRGSEGGLRNCRRIYLFRHAVTLSSTEVAASRGQRLQQQRLRRLAASCCCLEDSPVGGSGELLLGKGADGGDGSRFS